MEGSIGNKLWCTLQARLDCSALLHRGHRHSARLLRSLKQLERRKWDLDALVGRPAESLVTRAAQTDRHGGLTGKWRWVVGAHACIWCIVLPARFPSYLSSFAFVD